MVVKTIYCRGVGKELWKLHHGERPKTSAHRTILLEPGCIDILNRPQKTSFQYEEHCTTRMKLDHPHDLVIGSHLLDYVLNKAYHGIARPDGMVFRYANKWILEHLYEVKSGKGLDAENKVRGFSTLLDEMRYDLEPFTHQLRQIQHVSANPYDLNWPDWENIVIPANRQINIVFLSPYNTPQVLYGYNYRFCSITHRVVQTTHTEIE